MPTAIVCGGRDYADRDALFATLDRLRAEHGIVAIAHGKAAMVRRAREKGLPVVEVPR